MYVIPLIQKISAFCAPVFFRGFMLLRVHLNLKKKTTNNETLYET